MSSAVAKPLRVLLIPVGSAGDVHPFVGMALELRCRGHEVTVATNGHFRPLLDRLAIPFVEMGTDAQFREVIRNPDLWKAGPAATRLVFNMAARIMPQQHQLVSDGNWSVVVAHGLAMGARVAQEQGRAKVVSVQLAPSVFTSCVAPPKLPGLWMPGWMPMPLRRAEWWLAHRVVDRLIAGPINAFRRQQGLGPIRDVIRDWWHSPARIIGMWPDWFGPVVSDWPKQVRLTGFGLYDESGVTAMPAEVEWFVEAGSPPVAFTPGSANVHGRAFFQHSIDACRRLGCRGLLLTRHREQVPADLPAFVMHADFAPFGRLLPRCAAVVHHGGIGSVAQALAAGIPQLTTALSHDQFDNGSRVQHLSAGRWMSARRYTGARAAAALAELLGDATVAARCHEYRERLKPHAGLTCACDEIERAARGIS